MVVFTSQLLGILSFLVVSKIFVAIKRYTGTEQELLEIKHGQDPYWRLLLTNEESLSDFIEHEGYVMSSLTIMFTNLYVTIGSAILVYDEILQVKEYSLGFKLSTVSNVTTLVFFLWMVWKGTSFEKLFSTCNLIIMIFMVLLCVSTSIFAMIYGQVLVPKNSQEMSRYFSFFKTDVLIITLVNFLNQFFVIVRFIYYGSLKGSFDADSNQLKAE